MLCIRMWLVKTNDGTYMWFDDVAMLSFIMMADVAILAWRL